VTDTLRQKNWATEVWFIGNSLSTRRQRFVRLSSYCQAARSCMARANARDYCGHQRSSQATVSLRRRLRVPSLLSVVLGCRLLAFAANAPKFGTAQLLVATEPDAVLFTASTMSRETDRNGPSSDGTERSGRERTVPARPG
jgi:hypothetical protein